jgi:hypothetical protein
MRNALQKSCLIKIRKTFFKAQVIDCLLHEFRQIDQNSLHTTDTGALNPDVEKLQSGHVNATDPTAINPEKFSKTVFQPIKRG